jgi:hypothetical protein
MYHVPRITRSAAVADVRPLVAAQISDVNRGGASWKEITQFWTVSVRGEHSSLYHCWRDLRYTVLFIDLCSVARIESIAWLCISFGLFFPFAVWWLMLPFQQSWPSYYYCSLSFIYSREFRDTSEFVRESLCACVLVFLALCFHFSTLI